MSEPIGLITSRVTERLVQELQTETVATPFGPADLLLGRIGARDVACINRYGSKQTIPSHRVNYRANLWALRTVGVRRVISQNAIGSVNPALRPGDILIPHDLIDHTHSRTRSLFDDEACWVRVDMTHPFCEQMREVMIGAGVGLQTPVTPHGVFVCAEGPRFETPSEIRAFRQEGGDIVGTPLIPEAVIAREAELCYASIAAVINYGAGLAPAVVHSGPDGMVTHYYTSGLHERVEDLIAAAVTSMPGERTCACGRALATGFHGERPAWLVGSSLDK